MYAFIKSNNYYCTVTVTKLIFCIVRKRRMYSFIPVNIHIVPSLALHTMTIVFSIYYTVVKPEKHVLLRLLYPITGKWQEIGDLLGVDVDTIDSLYTSSLSNQVKMSKMLQSWLDNEPTPASWGNILDIIEGPLQNKTLAIEIRQKLKISKQFS